MCEVVILGNGVKAPGVERVTAEDPPDGIVDTLQRTMFLQGFRGVLGTGRMEPAVVARDEGGDDPLVKAYEADEDYCHLNSSLILCRSPVISSRTRGNETVTGAGLVRGDQRKTTLRVRSGRSPEGRRISLLFL